MIYMRELDGVSKLNFDLCEENIRAVNIARNLVGQDGDPNLITIVNANQFVAICNYDLSCLSYDLHNMKPGWKRNLQARVAILLIVEYMESVSSVIGPKFRASANPFYENVTDERRLNEISKALTLLRKEHKASLRKLRNAAIGHRDKDAQIQMAAIEALDVAQVAEIAVALTNWTNSLLNFFTYLLGRIFILLNSE